MQQDPVGSHYDVQIAECFLSHIIEEGVACLTLTIFDQ